MGSQYQTDADKALQEGRDRLTELFKQREAFDIWIAKQQRRVAALAALVDESEESDRILELNLGGLTDAVRGVLRGAGSTGLTPVEIRKRLTEMYFPVNEYKNFMASLGAVLHRLVKSSEVKRTIHDIQDGRDQSVYQWLPKYATNHPANQLAFQPPRDRTVFGFPDFADTVFETCGPALKRAYTDSNLANEMLAATPQISGNQAVIYMLVRMTLTGWVELLLLVGNGAGLGAMKIARGMFETAVMAEYLRQTPEEIKDYVEYGRVLSFKRLKLHKELLSAEQAQQIEQEYERVKPRFLNSRGRVRSAWNKHSMADMAEKIGASETYELSYSLAASIHHGNFEAMIGHLASIKEKLDVEQPPSLEWIEQALLFGHLYLRLALHTLNEFFKLNFDSRLEEAGAAFEKAYRKT